MIACPERVERVAEFGLHWQDCEEFLRRLGYEPAAP